MTASETTLRRSEIRSVLRRHKGSFTEIADSLGIKKANVSKWLKGQSVSANVAAACERKAKELLALESKQ